MASTDADELPSWLVAADEALSRMPPPMTHESAASAQRREAEDTAAAVKEAVAAAEAAAAARARDAAAAADARLQEALKAAEMETATRVEMETAKRVQAAMTAASERKLQGRPPVDRAAMGAADSNIGGTSQRLGGTIDADVLSAIDGLTATSMGNLLGTPALQSETVVACKAGPQAIPPIASLTVSTAQVAPADVRADSAIPAAAPAFDLSELDPLTCAPPPAAAPSGELGLLAATPLPAPLLAPPETVLHSTEVVPASPWSPAARSGQAPSAAPSPLAAVAERCTRDVAVDELAAMFPGMDVADITAVLQEAGSAEAAVDRLLRIGQAQSHGAATCAPTPRPRAANANANANAALFRAPQTTRAPQVTFKKGFFRSGPRIVS